MGEREPERPGMTRKPVTMEGPVCPVPIDHREVVVIGHGSGGRMTQALISRIFSPAFENAPRWRGADSAGVADPGHGRARPGPTRLASPPPRPAGAAVEGGGRVFCNGWRGGEERGWLRGVRRII